MDCVPVFKVKGLVECFLGYLRVAIVLEDTLLEFTATFLCEVDHRLDWHLVLHATDNNIVGELAEPL